MNAEADILSCTVLNQELQEDTENIAGEIVYTNNRVIIQALTTIDLTHIALDLELTEGASISPDPMELADYTMPRSFVVTSEDRNWHKEYIISIDTMGLPTRYTFDDYEFDNANKYHIFYSNVATSNTFIKQYIWASGNSAYSISGIAKNAEEYPTANVPRDDQGRMVQLATRSTGGWGALLGMPIAGGNLFIGTFDGSTAVSTPLKSPHMGLPFAKKPLRMKGEYAYFPGQDFVAGVDSDKRPNIISYKDTCDIYAVLYENEGLEQNTLDGSNILTSKNIVAVARLKDIEAIDAEPSAQNVTLQAFEVEFDYDKTDKAYYPPFLNLGDREDNCGILRPFDREKSMAYKYNMTFVCTSSKYAAFFAGAVNSVLFVDNVEIICE